MADLEDTHRRVVAFLAKEFARAEGRMCVLLEFASAQPGMRGVTLQTWDRRETPDIFEGQGNVESLATEILRRAEDEAESGGGGAHRYELRTHQHLGGRQTMSFRILVDNDQDQGASRGEDAPTATGLVAQLMRHNEANARTLIQVFQQALGTMSRTVADLSEENRNLRTDRARQLTELEAAKTAELEREVAAAKQIAADARKDKALEQIYDLFPVIKARILGTGTDASETPESILISELADSFSPDQMARIASALTPNQGVLLGELFQRAKAAKAKAAEAKAKTQAAIAAPAAAATMT